MQPLVVIGIPTYRRPVELARLLERLRELALPEDLRAIVVVVDNDPERTAEKVVLAAQEHTLELIYRTEAIAGVCHVRNRVLDEGRRLGADLVAFVDDDGSPDPGWLVAAGSRLRGAGAAAVTGPLLPTFDAPVAPWLSRVFSLCYVRGRADAELREMSAGNLLLDLAFLDRHGLRFEPSLSAHGGEDARLAQDIVAHGGRIVWADDALVLDHVPADRAGLGWLVERWYRTGNTETYLDLVRDGSVASRLRHVGKGIIRIMVGGALALACLPQAIVGDPEPLARRLYTIARGAGMIAAVMGARRDHYARPAAADPLAAGDGG